MGINRAINRLFKKNINLIPFTVQYSTVPSSAFRSSICSSSPHFVSSVRLSVCPLLRTACTPTVNIILCASLSLLRLCASRKCGHPSEIISPTCQVSLLHLLTCIFMAGYLVSLFVCFLFFIFYFFKLQKNLNEWMNVIGGYREVEGV